MAAVPVYDPKNRYTPIQAIHKHCLTCVAGDRKLLADCGGAKTCFLYNYRFGHRPNCDYVENDTVEPDFDA